MLHLPPIVFRTIDLDPISFRTESRPPRPPRRTGLTVWILLGLALALGAASAQATSPPKDLAEARSEAHLRVAATLPPLAWLVSQVAGPDVQVEHLVEPGDQPETFQPSDRRITEIARSAVFFRIGIPAENGPWLRALEKSGHVQVVDLRQGIEMRVLEGHSHGHRAHGHRAHGRQAHGHRAHGHRAHGAEDPHIWLSPRRLEQMGRIICRRLSALDPEGSGGYERRTAALSRRLLELDQELRRRLTPVQGRAFFVFHPTWGYFADDYGLRQIAVEIEGKEPTEREMTRLMGQARTLHMHTIFVQPQIRSSTPHQLAEMLGARVESLDPLAPDVLANLDHVANRLLTALQPGEAEP